MRSSCRGFKFKASALCLRQPGYKSGTGTHPPKPPNPRACTFNYFGQAAPKTPFSPPNAALAYTTHCTRSCSLKNDIFMKSVKIRSCWPGSHQPTQPCKCTFSGEHVLTLCFHQSLSSQYSWSLQEHICLRYILYVMYNKIEFSPTLQMYKCVFVPSY